MKTRRSVVSWMSLLVLLVAIGCATQRPSRVIYEQGEAGKSEAVIRLDRLSDDRPFSHPATVSASRLRELLSMVQVKRRPGLATIFLTAKPRAAFTDSEVELLASHASTALAEAAPEEMVVFYLNVPRIGQIANVTSGGLYVEDDQLVLLLANYQYEIAWGKGGMSKQSVSARQVRHDPLYTYPGNDYMLIAGPGQTLLGGEPGLMNTLFGKKQNGVVMSVIASMPEPDESRPTGFEEKLRTLKKLLDEGLINAEDYQKKKKELLDQF